MARHTVRLWRTGQLRFRLETYGLYYPAPPYAAPWWRPSPRVAVSLLAGLPAYSRWLRDMERMAAEGGASWWRECETPRTHE